MFGTLYEIDNDSGSFPFSLSLEETELMSNANYFIQHCSVKVLNKILLAKLNFYVGTMTY